VERRGNLNGKKCRFPVKKKRASGIKDFMAKLKNEMRRVHRRKIRKAKERLKLEEKSKEPYSELNSTARKVFYKRLKAGYEFPARIKSA